MSISQRDVIEAPGAKLRQSREAEIDPEIFLLNTRWYELYDRKSPNELRVPSGLCGRFEHRGLGRRCGRWFGGSSAIGRQAVAYAKLAAEQLVLQQTASNQPAVKQ